MKLDKTTFGKTPAAIYLADYLNKLGKPIVTKRAGKMLTSYRNTLSQLGQANKIGVLNAHNLARVVSSIREHFQVDVGDELASNLVTNTLVGEMKSLLRKSSEIRKIEMLQNRVIGHSEILGEFKNKKGYSVARVTEDTIELPSYTVSDVTDEINAETLTLKWEKKMKRRNKTI